MLLLFQFGECPLSVNTFLLVQFKLSSSVVVKKKNEVVQLQKKTKNYIIKLSFRSKINFFLALRNSSFRGKKVLKRVTTDNFITLK